MRRNNRITILFLIITSLLIIAVSVACTSLYHQYSISQGISNKSDTRQISHDFSDNKTSQDVAATPKLPNENETKQPEPSEKDNKDKNNSQGTNNHSNIPAGKPAENSGATHPEKDLISKYKQELLKYKELNYFKQENTDRYVLYKIKNPDYTYEKVITYVNIGIDQDFYKNINVIKGGHDITVLVNKFHKLPDTFKPELVQLDPSICVDGRGPQYMHPEAARAFIQMHEDAKLLGLNITAYGTYRSIETQHSIWNRAVSSGRTIEDVDSLNARGGHSEHHTGLAIDVIKNNYSVENTEEFKWYRENAHKYGFIIRYPEGMEYITGYKYEPWHLRYVGDIAEDIYNSGLTYEEYYFTVMEPNNK